MRGGRVSICGARQRALVCVPFGYCGPDSASPQPGAFRAGGAPALTRWLGGRLVALIMRLGPSALAAFGRCAPFRHDDVILSSRSDVTPGRCGCLLSSHDDAMLGRYLSRYVRVCGSVTFPLVSHVTWWVSSHHDDVLLLSHFVLSISYVPRVPSFTLCALIHLVRSTCSSVLTLRDDVMLLFVSFAESIVYGYLRLFEDLFECATAFRNCVAVEAARNHLADAHGVGIWNRSSRAPFRCARRGVERMFDVRFVARRVRCAIAVRLHAARSVRGAGSPGCGGRVEGTSGTSRCDGGLWSVSSHRR